MNYRQNPFKRANPHNIPTHLKHLTPTFENNPYYSGKETHYFQKRNHISKPAFLVNLHQDDETSQKKAHYINNKKWYYDYRLDNVFKYPFYQQPKIAQSYLIPQSLATPSPCYPDYAQYNSYSTLPKKINQNRQNYYSCRDEQTKRNEKNLGLNPQVQANMAQQSSIIQAISDHFDNNNEQYDIRLSSQNQLNRDNIYNREEYIIREYLPEQFKKQPQRDLPYVSGYTQTQGRLKESEGILGIVRESAKRSIPKMQKFENSIRARQLQAPDELLFRGKRFLRMHLS